MAKLAIGKVLEKLKLTILNYESIICVYAAFLEIVIFYLAILVYY